MVEIIHEMICRLDASGGVMTLVAYKNQREINLPVAKRIYIDQVAEGTTNDFVPNSVDSYIEFTVKSYVNAPNEPSRWRILWFINGLLLMKVEEISEIERSCEDLLADKTYPSASGSTKCCSREGHVRGRTNHEHNALSEVR